MSSYCAVSGFKTDRRWKGKLIHPMVLKKAKSMESKFFEDSLRKKIARLQRQFKADRYKMNFEDTEEDKSRYEQWAKDYFKC